ncbi:hypothetical protein GCM10028798_20550 [Humibacter antri]
MTAGDPLRPVRHPIPLLVLGLCGIVLTGALGFAVTHVPHWTVSETDALGAIATTHTQAGLALAEFIAWFFSPLIAASLTLLLAIAVWALTRSFTRALVFAVMIGLCWGGTEAMKFLVQRPRPHLSVTVVETPTSFSFPSGHTAFACAIVLALLLTLRDWRYEWVVIVLGSGVVVLVAWSRMYLGVHFPTDVTASVLLTVSVAGVVIPLIVNVAIPALRGRHGTGPGRTGAGHRGREGAIHGQ